MLDRSNRVLETASYIGVVLGGYAFVILSIAVCLEILLRQFAGVSLQGIDEYSGYVLAGASAVGFSYALLQRAHTRVDLVLAKLSAKTQAVLNCFAGVMFASAACFMAWRAVAAVMRSYSLGSTAATPMQTPIWIPQSIWAFGMVLTAVTAIFLVLRGVSSYARSGEGAVNALLGPPNMQEEIAEVIADGDGEVPR